MIHHTDTDARIRAADDWDSLTRREYLAIIGLAYGFVAAHATDELHALALPTDAAATGSGVTAAGLLMDETDLSAPAGAYARWRVDTDRAPLLGHVRRTVPGLESADSAAVGFVARGDGVLRSVEAAVIDVDAASAPAVVDATAAWLTSTFGPDLVTAGPAVRADERTWSVDVTEATRDAYFLFPVDGFLLFVVGSGRRDQLTTLPTTAQRYRRRVAALLNDAPSHR